MGQHPPQVPDGFPMAMAAYHWYAEAYHFSPDVVDKLSLEQDYWFRAMKEASEQAQAVLTADAARKDAPLTYR